VAVAESAIDGGSMVHRINLDLGLYQLAQRKIGMHVFVEKVIYCVLLGLESKTYWL